MNKISHDSEVPSQGQQVFTATAFIHGDFEGTRKVFLPRRAETKKFLPGLFEMPGGHIDFGEDMKAGLAREVMEEIGMKIRIGDPYHVFTYTNEIKGSHSIEVCYFAEFEDSYENIQLHPEDHSEFVWASESELPAQLSTEERTAIVKGFSLMKGELHLFK